VPTAPHLVHHYLADCAPPLPQLAPSTWKPAIHARSESPSPSGPRRPSRRRPVGAAAAGRFRRLRLVRTGRAQAVRPAEPRRFGRPRVGSAGTACLLEPTTRRPDRPLAGPAGHLWAFDRGLIAGHAGETRVRPSVTEPRPGRFPPHPACGGCDAQEIAHVPSPRLDVEPMQRV